MHYKVMEALVWGRPFAVGGNEVFDSLSDNHRWIGAVRPGYLRAVNTFIAVDTKDGWTITCLRPDCGRTSWNINDVTNRYCGNCHLFHVREMIRRSDGGEYAETDRLSLQVHGGAAGARRVSQRVG